MEQTFDEIWAKLAELGFCDELYSAEYTRCRESWECYDCFTAITASILTNANKPPPPPLNEASYDDYQP